MLHLLRWFSVLDDESLTEEIEERYEGDEFRQDVIAEFMQAYNEGKMLWYLKLKSGLRKPARNAGLQESLIKNLEWISAISVNPYLRCQFKRNWIQSSRCKTKDEG